jgi:hypothetical protein
VKLRFHSFRLGDVEDPSIYAAPGILAWQDTAQGQWAMNHARDVEFVIQTDPTDYGYQVVIQGQIDDPKLITEYHLRF